MVWWHIKVCFNARPMDGKLAWHEEFSNWNASNLESLGVVTIENEPHVVLVINTHPAMSFLRSNPCLMSQDLVPKADGQYYRMSIQLLAMCCNTIRDHIFK